MLKIRVLECQLHYEVVKSCLQSSLKIEVTDFWLASGRQEKYSAHLICVENYLDINYITEPFHIHFNMYQW